MQNPTQLSNITLKDGGKIEGAETLVPTGAPTNMLLQRHPKEPSEHAILLSKGITVYCLIDGETIPVVIQPFKFADLDNVLEAVTPIYNKLETLAKTREEVFNLVKDSKKLLEFIKTYKEKIYFFMLAFNPKLTKEFVSQLDIGTVAELLLTIVTVNIDFFMQEASEKLKEVLTDLAIKVIPKLGKSATG